MQLSKGKSLYRISIYVICKNPLSTYNYNVY